MKRTITLLAAAMLGGAIARAGEEGPTRAQREAVSRVAGAVIHVEILAPRRAARSLSGVVLSASESTGYVATFLEGLALRGRERPRFEVVLRDLRVVPADVVGVDGRTGVALLRVPAGGATPVTAARGLWFPSGARLLAVTNPTGIQPNVTWVTFRDTYLRPPGDTFSCMLMRFDLPFRPEEEGGVVLDREGRAIALIAGRPARGPVEPNLAARESDAPPPRTGPELPPGGYAVPMELVVRVCRQLARAGRVERGYVGATFGWLTKQARAARGIDAAGIEVLEIRPGGPADRAGLRRGDVVVEVRPPRDGRPMRIKTIGDVIAIAERVEFELVGKALRLAVLRADPEAEGPAVRRLTITVSVEPLPASTRGFSPSPPSPGGDR